MRTFGVRYTTNWIALDLDFQQANSHAEVLARLGSPAKRVTNTRFREIEKTGKYYSIYEHCKGGKTFIYELCS